MKKLTTIALILIAILILGALGYYFFGTGTWSRNPSLYGTNQSDGIVKGYLERMIPHHIEGVDISKRVMIDKDITVPEIRLFAARVADREEFQIGQMKGWYTEWFGIPVPLFVYKRTLTETDATGNALAQVYLEEMLAYNEYQIDESQRVHAFIEEIESRHASTDGQLTIVNSHPGIDTTLVFTKQIEDEKMEDNAEIRELLSMLKK